MTGDWPTWQNPWWWQVPSPTWTSNVYPSKTPHKCPVCDGIGKVKPGFYGKSKPPFGRAKDDCRSCQATGVLWS